MNITTFEGTNVLPAAICSILGKMPGATQLGAEALINFFPVYFPDAVKNSGLPTAPSVKTAMTQLHESKQCLYITDGKTPTDRDINPRVQLMTEELRVQLAEQKAARKALMEARDHVLSLIDGIEGIEGQEHTEPGLIILRVSKKTSKK